jgi:trigger factor
MGVVEATVEALRADIRKNLEREVKFRLLGKNKQAALDALVAHAELDLPNSIVQSELDRMVQGAREELKQRGIKDADQAPIPDDVFRPQAERRVRMGLVVSEVVRMHNLQATPDQIKAHVEDLAASYEKPAEVIRWYYSDSRRMAEVEAIVIENNVTNYVLSLVKAKTKEVSFDELMSQQA